MTDTRSAASPKGNGVQLMNWFRSVVLIAGVSSTVASSQSVPSQVGDIVCTEATCDHVYSNGFLFVVGRGPEANVVTGGIVRTGHHVYLAVAVRNRSEKNLDVIPETFTLTTDDGGKSKVLRFVAPEQAIRSEASSPGWATFFDGLAAASANQRSTVRSNSDAMITANSNDGSVFTGSVRTNETSTVTTPDNAAREAARERIAVRAEERTAKRSQLESSSLKATTVAPGASVMGLVFFEPDKKANRFLLTVRVDGVPFRFELSLR